MKPTLVDRLVAIASLFQQNTQRLLRSGELTSARAQALWVLFHTGPSSQRTLTQALGTTARSVSALVDGLEATGFATREPDPHDRRAVLVTLTEAGIAEMWRRQEEHVRLSKQLLDAVDPADREAFERGVDAVFRRLDELVRQRD